MTLINIWIVTAIKLLFISILLFSIQAKAQVSYYTFKETDQIIIHAKDTSKIQVYFFLDADGNSFEKSRLELLFQTNIIDYSNFEFHVLHITLIDGCTRKLKMELYNYDKLKFDFPVQPFYCLIDSRGANYEKLKYERTERVEKDPFIKIYDVNGKFAPFEAIRDVDIIQDLLFISSDAYAQIGNLSQISSDSKTQGKLIDSLQNELDKTNTKLQRSSSFIRMDLMPFPLSFPSLREGNTMLGHTMRQASWAVQVYKFPFEFNEDFGWISSLGYSSLSGNFSTASRVDTINRNAIDPDGESYIRIAKLNNLSESYSLINLKYQLAPIYRWRTENGQFSVY